MTAGNFLTFLVNCIWQVPLITAVAALLNWLMRNGPASYRHAVWIAALTVAVVLPISSVRPAPPIVTPAVIAQVPSPAAGVIDPPAVRRSAQATSPQILIPFASRPAHLLLRAYELFLLIRLALFGLAWAAAVRLRRGARHRDVPLHVRNVWARCLATFDLGRVDLLASPSLTGPVMAGAFRRQVIVPDALLEQISADVLTSALGHEAAHAARHDFVVNLLCELLYIPISFNPVAWILRHGIRRTRELACDELVAARLLDPRAYARSILNLAAAMKNPARRGYVLGVFDGDILEERIRRLMQRRRFSRPMAWMLLAAGLSALVVCFVLCSGLALSARAQSAGGPDVLAGVRAFNQGDYVAAIDHFRAAVDLDSSNLLARLHLANAYGAAFRMRPDGPPNHPGESWLLTSARRQYEDVLSLDPVNATAIIGLVSVALPEDYTRSRELLTRLISSDPRNATAYYELAVIDWCYAYPRVQKALHEDAARRPALRVEVRPKLQEGVAMSQRALELDPQSADAMAYLSLLYRLLAEVEDDPGQAKALIASADRIVGQAISARRVPQFPRPQVQSDAPPPLTSMTVPAPPPPPPPKR